MKIIHKNKKKGLFPSKGMASMSMIYIWIIESPRYYQKRVVLVSTEYGILASLALWLIDWDFSNK
jgi:hypothetical protein